VGSLFGLVLGLLLGAAAMGVYTGKIVVSVEKQP
jgi:hypothetical protein